ncbi:SDR family oxidoreductase [Gammaproteobacteria bacterium]|nr:SDR family oxidoreductase [Gammaproteobacteria bacterium]
MKRKVLVLGSTGMIGHQVYRHLEQSGEYELFNFSSRNKLNNQTIIIDATNDQEFFQEIKKTRPDFIINCIGILIEGSDADKIRAIQLNALLPHKLARLADSINSKLLHMSTDCVFSGRKKEPYIENDEKDGLDTYAITKGLGEIISDRHLTLRTSVVGPELKIDGNELFNWFMRQNIKISGYPNAIWSGVTSLELAKVVKWAIDNDIIGLYHVTNNSCISKFDLLQLFNKHSGNKIDIIPSDTVKVDKSFIDTRELIDFTIPTYDQMVSDMIKSIQSNSKLYPQYNL